MTGDDSGFRLLSGIGLVLGVVAAGLLAIRLTEPRLPERGGTPSVLLVGDSLLDEAAPAVRTALAGMRVVDAAVPGSGLLTPRGGWFRRVRHLLERVHPSVVVASFVGNVDRSEGGPSPNTRAYYIAWSRAALRINSIARHAGARVYWLAQPPIATVNFYGIAAAQPRVLSRVYQRLGERRGTHFVDGSASVASRDGAFVAAKVVCGRLRTLRLADGVHFTAAGAAWWGIHLARGIARFERRHIDGSCRLFDLVGLHRVSVTEAIPPTEGSQEPRSRL